MPYSIARFRRSCLYDKGSLDRRGEELISFEDWKDAAIGSTTTYFYPTTATLVTFKIVGSKVFRTQHFGPAVASGMSRRRGTIMMPGGRLASAFAFIEYERGAHSLPHLQDGAWTAVQYD